MDRLTRNGIYQPEKEKSSRACEPHASGTVGATNTEAPALITYSAGMHAMRHVLNQCSVLLTTARLSYAVVTACLRITSPIKQICIAAALKKKQKKL